MSFSAKYHISNNALIRKTWWQTRSYPFEDIRYIHERIKIVKASLSGQSRFDPKRVLVLEMKNGQTLTLTIVSPQLEHLAAQLIHAMPEKFVAVGETANKSLHQQGRARDHSLLIFTIRGFSSLLIFPVWINLREGDYLRAFIFLMITFLGIVVIPRIIRAIYKST